MTGWGWGGGVAVSQLAGCCAQTHKAAKDWYLQYGYAHSGCPARVELEGPINVSFSTLAAMSMEPNRLKRLGERLCMVCAC